MFTEYEGNLTAMVMDTNGNGTQPAADVALDQLNMVDVGFVKHPQSISQLYILLKITDTHIYIEIIYIYIYTYEYT